MTEDRVQKAQFSSWAGIVGNLSLAIMKGTVGYISGSKALIADALYSAAHVAGSFAALLRLRNLKLQPDVDHPVGHGKTGSAAGIIASVLLLIVGTETAISSAKAIYQGVDSPPAAYALVAIVISMIAKVTMFQYDSGKKLSGQTLLPRAAEHRSDLFSTGAALLGAGGAVLGDYLGNKYLYYLDPVAGLFIAVLVLRTAYRVVSDSVYSSKEHVFHNEDVAELLRTVQAVNGVIAVDDIRAREHGHYVIVDVKISVNPRISVLEGHDVAKAVKQTLMKRFIHIADVTIHVHPYDPGYPYKNNAYPQQDDFPSVLH
jgi:cation diffusion facilitator family transporter